MMAGVDGLEKREREREGWGLGLMVEQKNLEVDGKLIPTRRGNILCFSSRPLDYYLVFFFFFPRSFAKRILI